MVRSLRTTKNNTGDHGDHTKPVTEIPQQSSDFWVVCGKLKRRTKKQVWRDKLRRLVLQKHDVMTEPNPAENASVSLLVQKTDEVYPT